MPTFGEHTSRQLRISAPHQVAFVDSPLPPLGPREVLVRSALSGISHGTEMTAFLGTNPFIKRTLTPERTFADKTSSDDPFFPFAHAGYDIAGVVEEVGKDVTLFKVGDRVWAPKPHQTFFVMEEANPEIQILSENIANEDAILTNLATVALAAINDAEIKLGDAVAIFGGGAVGQLAAQMAVLSGARSVYLVEPSAPRRALAKSKMPVHTIDPISENPAQAILAHDGASPDVVVECSGSVRALRAAVAAAGVAGTVVAAGFYAGNAAEISLGEEFLHNRVTLKASMHVWGCPSRHPERWNRTRIVREVWHLMDRKRLDLAGFLGTTFPFEEAQQAYDIIHKEQDKYLKVAFTY